MSALILIVEDEPQLAEIPKPMPVRRVTTERAGDGVSALSVYRAASPDLILLDGDVARQERCARRSSRRCGPMAAHP